MVALLRLAEAPELDLDALGRGLVRLSAIDQVLLGGTLMRMKHPNLAGLGEALACRGARRLATPIPDPKDPT